MSQDLSYDIVVIGAGIVGCSIAETLSERGFKVAVIEDKAIGSGATAEGMGHIVVLDDNDQLLKLSKRSKELWIERSKQLPETCEFFQPGTLWLAESEEEMEHVEGKKKRLAEFDIQASLLSKDALLKREPNLSTRFFGGMVVEDDAVLYPPVAAKFFLDNAIRNGAELIKARAKSIEEGCVHLDDGRSIKCNTSINACGAMAHDLSPEIEIIPMKGHLMITDRYPGYINHQLLAVGYQSSAANVNSDSFAFNIQPRKNGQLLIGSTRQVGDLGRDIKTSVLYNLINCLRDYIPGIVDLQVIRTWTGFRAGTSSKLPLIGSHPSIKGHMIASGHGGLGITNALGTAEIIADTLEGKTPKIAIEPFLPKKNEANLSA